jgi:hypothetical protein
MPDAFQYDVFLSHSAKDKPVVRPLAEQLRNDGLKAWFDEWVLGLEVPSGLQLDLALTYRRSSRNWRSGVSMGEIS